MQALGQSLRQLGQALWELFVAVFEFVAPWLPLILGLGAWIVFWTCAVDWVRFREMLVRGGWIGLVLAMFAAVLVWSAVDPPEHYRVELTDGTVITGTLVGFADEAVTIVDGSGRSISIPENQIQTIEGQHRLLGLLVSNFVGKTVYVTALVCIMLLCGSVQLGGCCRVRDDEPAEVHSLGHDPHHAAAH